MSKEKMRKNYLTYYNVTEPTPEEYESASKLADEFLKEIDKKIGRSNKDSYKKLEDFGRDE